MSCRIIDAKTEDKHITPEADGTSALAAEITEPSAFVAKKWKIRSSEQGLTYTPVSGKNDVPAAVRQPEKTYKGARNDSSMSGKKFHNPFADKQTGSSRSVMEQRASFPGMSADSSYPEPKAYELLSGGRTVEKGTLARIFESAEGGGRKTAVKSETAVNETCGDTDVYNKSHCEEHSDEYDKTLSKGYTKEYDEADRAENDTERDTAETAVDRTAEARDVYIPMGSEYVRAGGSRISGECRHQEAAAGIIYEVAEELYRREKTQTEIEALCRPPFRRVFDSEMIEQLDREVKERTMRMIAVPDAESEKPDEPEEEETLPQEIPKPMTTARAFGLELLMMLPVINIIAAVILSFGSGRNINVRSFARGHLVLSLMIMTAALGFFAYSYFTAPDSEAFIEKIMSLFG